MKIENIDNISIKTKTLNSFDGKNNKDVKAIGNIDKNTTSVSNMSAEEINKKIKQFELEKEDLKKKLDDATKEFEVTKEKINNLDIDHVNSKISGLNLEISTIDSKILDINSQVDSIDREISQNDSVANDDTKLNELKKEAEFIGQAANLVKKNAAEYSKLNIDVAKEEANAKKILSEINSLENELNLERSKPTTQIDYTKFNKEVERKIDSLVSEIKRDLDSFDKGVNKNDTIMAVNSQFTYDNNDKFASDIYKNLFQDKEIWKKVESLYKLPINDAYKTHYKVDNFFSVLEAKLKDFADVSDNFKKLSEEYTLIESEMSKAPQKDLTLFEKLSKFNEKLKAGYYEMLEKKNALETSLNIELTTHKKLEVDALNKNLLLKKNELAGIQSRLNQKLQFEGIISNITDIIAKANNDEAGKFKKIAQSFIAVPSNDNMNELIGFVDNLSKKNKLNIDTLNGGKNLLIEKNEGLILQKEDLLNEKIKLESTKISKVNEKSTYEIIAENLQKQTKAVQEIEANLKAKEIEITKNKAAIKDNREIEKLKEDASKISEAANLVKEHFKLVVAEEKKAKDLSAEISKLQEKRNAAVKNNNKEVSFFEKIFTSKASEIKKIDTDIAKKRNELLLVGSSQLDKKNKFELAMSNVAITIAEIDRSKANGFIQNVQQFANDPTSKDCMNSLNNFLNQLSTSNKSSINAANKAKARLINKNKILEKQMRELSNNRDEAEKKRQSAIKKTIDNKLMHEAAAREQQKRIKKIFDRLVERGQEGAELEEKIKTMQRRRDSLAKTY